MKKFTIILPAIALVGVLAVSAQATGCYDYCQPTPTVEPSPVASATATPDTKGDGPTGPTNTEPDRINHPTASNGAGIGGSSGR